jgi:hypothetical protein
MRTPSVPRWRLCLKQNRGALRDRRMGNHRPAEIRDVNPAAAYLNPWRRGSRALPRFRYAIYEAI